VLLTQEFLAEMLGVQRTYVTRVAKALQAAGVIRYQRGRITILDRARLEQASCECHAAVRAHFDRVLAGVYPSETARPGP
jgi:Mn-dependent DtxR family transcriptional regulator